MRQLLWGHFGVVKINSLARLIVWWPSLQRDIEDFAKNCAACNSNRDNPPKVGTHRGEIPDNVFEQEYGLCAVIFMKIFLILVDVDEKFLILHAF